MLQLRERLDGVPPGVSPPRVTHNPGSFPGVSVDKASGFLDVSSEKAAEEGKARRKRGVLRPCPFTLAEAGAGKSRRLLRMSAEC